jgi:hypothetical protein
VSKGAGRLAGRCGPRFVRDNPELQRSGLTCDIAPSHSVHLPPSRGLVAVSIGRLNWSDDQRLGDEWDPTLSSWSSSKDDQLAIEPFLSGCVGVGRVPATEVALGFATQPFDRLGVETGDGGEVLEGAAGGEGAADLVAEAFGASGRLSPPSSTRSRVV